MPIVVVGLSHHTCPVDVRERFAFSAEAIPGVVEKLKGSGIASEAVILSTCNRTELYAVVPDGTNGTLQALRDFLAEDRGCVPAPASEFYMHPEPHSLEHLFKVVSGLDSMVLGETEILGQAKKAYDLALQNRQTGPRLNKAFQRAFNVSKYLRTETNIQRGSVSVGSVAVELAEKIFSSLRERHVMVIGAGETSEKTARSLLSRGAQSVMVSNRSHDRAVALAAELGGRAIHFEEWAREFDTIDIIISSTSAPHYVLDRVKLEQLLRNRRSRPLLLIDIAVPRDIDPEVNLLDSVYLYNIDDLQAIADGYLQQRKEEIARCEEHIREKARALLTSPGAPPQSAKTDLAFET